MLENECYEIIQSDCKQRYAVMEKFGNTKCELSKSAKVDLTDDEVRCQQKLCNIRP